jgi:hypothetical protein
MALAALAPLGSASARADTEAVQCGPAPLPAPGEAPRWTTFAQTAVGGDPSTEAGAQPVGISFDVAHRFTVSVFPVSTAAADLDGDGWPDLAVAASDGDSLALVLAPLGSSTGIRRAVRLPAKPFDVAAGDLDHDGRADLVCSLWDAGAVATLRNQGGGAFAAAVLLPAGTEPRGVALADLDRDGDLDVAVAAYADNAVRLMRNRGDGTFEAAEEHVVGTGPMTLLATDIDRDGDVDLVTADAGCLTVSCLLNHGNGTFGSRVQSRVPDNPYGLAAADLDGDGDVDLAMTGPSRRAILLGDGAGRFLPDPGFSPPGDYESAGVAAADLDDDGRADLVFSERGYCEGGCFATFDLARVWHNQGAGLFEPRIGFRTITGSQRFGVADLDLDGRSDLVTVGTVGPPHWGLNHPGAAILLGRGDGRMGGVQEFAFSADNDGRTGSRLLRVAAITLSPGGADDLIVGTGGFDVPTITSLIHNLDANGFGAPVQVAPGLPLDARDLDGDGLGDLLSTHGDTLEMRRGLPTRELATPVEIATGVVHLATGDLDGDGRLDLALRDSTWRVLVAHGLDGGTFESPAPAGAQLLVPQPGYGEVPQCFAAADIDRDGREDLLVSRTMLPPNREAEDSLVVFRSHANGGLDSAMIVALPKPLDDPGYGSQPIAIEVADLDADGWKDVLTLHHRSWYLAFFCALLSRPGGLLELRSSESAGSYDTSDLEVGDFNDDDLMDAIVVDPHSDDTGALFLLTGRGDGTFDVRRDDAWGDYTSSLAVARIDVDQRLDIAYVSPRGNWLAVALGTLAEDDPTPVVASLVSASTENGIARLVWRLERAGNVVARVSRSDDAGASWRERARLVPEGDGTVRFEDAEVAPGGHYGYRLVLGEGSAAFTASEVWLDVPAAPALALAGATPNPVEGDLTVAFTLAAHAPATLALFDLAGRRVASREVGALGAGRHRVRLAERAALEPGLYFVRLTAGAEALTSRVAVVR